MTDKIVPVGIEPKSDQYYSLLLHGREISLGGKPFTSWTGYLSEVVDSKLGSVGTIVFIPHVKPEELFKK